MTATITITGLGGSDSLLLVIAYVVVYWLVLIAILKNAHFSTQEKILWFLVITLAPVVGLAAYWYLDPLPDRPIFSNSEAKDSSN
jgi:hypothetical protein